LLPDWNRCSAANAYVIEEESGFLLFDTSIGTERSQAALVEGLARSGHHFFPLEERHPLLLPIPASEVLVHECDFPAQSPPPAVM
jgi:hypothetical protein